MRKLTNFENEEMAEAAQHFLIHHDIECEVLAGDGFERDLWVVDEDRLNEARSLLDTFKIDPGKYRHLIPSKTAKTVTQATDIVKRSASVQRQRFSTLTEHNGATKVMMAICILIFFFIATGIGSNFTQLLFYSAFRSPLFVEISEGQIWRLVTPIFLHFNILHIAFNMIWLYQLGSVIEGNEGPKMLIFLVIVIGVLSNTGEYIIPPHNPFGGMSGVIYGLMGYIWTMGRFKPHSGYFLDQGTLWFMIIWLFLGMTGMFGPTANWCHLVGLVSGLIMGYLASLRSSR